MRDFCKVSPKAWRSRKLRAVSERAKLLYLYLLTSPHCNAVGCYYMTAKLIEDDLGDNVAATLPELVDAGLIRYDAEESVVYVLNFIRFNAPMNLSHTQMMFKEARSVQVLAFRKDLIEEIVAEVAGKDWKGLDTVLRQCRHSGDTGATQDQTIPDQTPTRPAKPRGGLPFGAGGVSDAVKAAVTPPGSDDLANYDVGQYLRPETREKARQYANGFAIEYLIERYNEWIRNEKRPPAINPNLAFPGWVKSYVKDRKPA